MLRLYLLVAMITILGSVGYGGYYYITGLQQQVTTLTANNIQLENVVATQEKTIEQIKQNAARQAELNRELNSKLVEAEAGLDRLRRRFTQIDITKEALEDPAGLETRINNAVNRLINEIEKETSPTELNTDDVSTQ